ncbi:MAG: IS3 family transposase [Lachnospiraceae bacterium]
MILEDPAIKFNTIHTILQDAENLVDVNTLCEIAGVSRSGYYRWVKAAESRERHELQDRADFELIQAAFKHRGYDKGARGIYMQLLHQDPPIVMNIKKIRRLMKKYGLLCPIRKANPYRRMAKAIRTSHVADYLVERKFTDFGPRMILLTDITYIPYYDGKERKFAYLSTIIDAYTRQVLSYVVSDSLEVDFVLETVEQLVRNHGVSLHTETIINSDQGAHYTSNSFIQILRDHEFRQSMSHRGNCWDNAPQESFFGHMKDEIDINAFTCYEDVKAAIDDWMDYYNNERYQWQLAKLSPNEYYDYCMTGRYPLCIPAPNQAKQPADNKQEDDPARN